MGEFDDDVWEIWLWDEVVWDRLPVGRRGM